VTLTSPASLDDCLEPATDAHAVEAELVREALQGSSAAAREIVRLHHRRIFSFLRQMTHQHQDAEDITQETFIKAFKSLHRFDTSRPLANWLFTIARRTALNHFRSSRPWVTIPEETPSESPSPAAQVEEHDQVDDLWAQARRRLPRREYDVLWLRFGENLSTEETAQVMGLTKVHVKILVFRARRRLTDGKAAS
jgi:RNA polymerase sigma-70 factor (ECF subfamily)